jgi:hypothetical protein
MERKTKDYVLREPVRCVLQAERVNKFRSSDVLEHDFNQ